MIDSKKLEHVIKKDYKEMMCLGAESSTFSIGQYNNMQVHITITRNTDKFLMVNDDLICIRKTK